MARVSKRGSRDRVGMEGRKIFIETARFEEISVGAFLDWDLFVDGGLVCLVKLEFMVWRVC